MKNNKTENIKLPSREAMRKTVLSSVMKEEMERKNLIVEVIKNCGFGAEELKDTSCDSLSTKLKSYSGIIINELAAENAILVNEEGKYSIIKNKQIDKKDIIEKLSKRYLTEEEQKDRTSGSKKNVLTAVLGDLIKKKEAEALAALDHIDFFDAEMRKNETILNRIINSQKKAYPDSPLGNKLEQMNAKYESLKKGMLKASYYQKELEKEIIECINLAGGEFFERLSLALLISCYGENVIKNQLTGGPDDNGIDGILQIRDSLGFEETILFQAKTKKKTTRCIALTDIREFAGVMSAEKAAKGILISNSNFHADAVKFARKIKNLKLINKEELFDLMIKTQVGLKKDASGIYCIDETLFI